MWRYRLSPPVVEFGLGALALLAPTLAYNAVCFGGPFDLAYHHMVQAEHQVHRSTGFFGIGLPRLDALWGLSFGPARGLFVHSPMLLLVFPAAWRIAERGWQARHTFALLVVLGYFVVNASLIDWQGGWTLGPRYLIPVLPFVAWIVFEGYQREGTTGRALYRTFAGAAVTWALLLHGLALATWSMPPYSNGLVFPAMELGWALLREGVLAPNRGALLGLAGAGSLLPPIVALAVALAALVRERAAAVAAIVALLLFVGTAGLLERSLGAQGRRDIAYFPPLMGYRPTPR